MISHETNDWFIDGDRHGGVLLVRKADAASIYFCPGDDAKAIRETVELIESISDEFNFARRFNEACQVYGDQLDRDVAEGEAAAEALEDCNQIDGHAV